MRRLLLAVLAAAALAGCGDEPEGPLDSVLGFFPEKAPLVAVVDTDPDGEQQRAVREIAKRFPFRIPPGGGLGGLFGPSLFLGPLGPFEASVRAETEGLSGSFVQRFD